ncbi:MAG: hypothetical protein O2971_06050 [Proteobacteria bacterium]|nr:hypothetical protein [Pseudomonadota bacterium]
MKKHPQLARKFQLLFALHINPAIKSNADIARVLGISRQSVSRWCRGTSTSQGDAIPHYQLESLSAEFDLQPHWFNLSFEEFELRVKRKKDSETGAKDDAGLRISTSTMPITNVQIFGRGKELDRLNNYWDEGQTNIVQLIAFGGVGKSTLVNRWLSDLHKEDFGSAKQVYAWSFYWQGESSEAKSSGDLFIEHALDWFGDVDSTAGTPWAKASRLALHIRKSKTLLILDGMEPMQYPPGPKFGQIENPAIALLVRELASDNTGLCVITSRIPIGDLISFEDGRVATVNLEQLSVVASKQLLSSMGVHGNDGIFESIAQYYSGHALSLSLLGGFLRVVHKGEVEKYRSIKSLTEEQQQGQHASNIIYAYLNWFKGTQELELMYWISMFDRAVTLNTIKSLVDSKTIAGLTSKLAGLSNSKWSYSVQVLDEANLISANSLGYDIVLDCHPIVRDFIASHLKEQESEIWIKGNESIFSYLMESAADSPGNMAELEPLFRAVIHGANARLYIEAFQVYFERIKKRQFSIFTEGSHHADQACIRSFFKREWNELIEELPENVHGYLLSSVATNLIYLGEINAAIAPSSISINWFIQNELWIEAVCAAAPLVSMLIAAGKLSSALSLMEEMEPIVEKTQNSIVIAMAANFRAYVSHLSGQKSLAKKYFDQSENVLVQLRPEEFPQFPTISSYYCKFLLDTGALQEALERSLKTFAWREQKSWQVAIDTTSLLASDLLVLGLTFLKLGDRINAKVQLDKQIELFKAADEWLYLPTGLNSRARLHIATENFSEAVRDLNESLDISLRTGARFGEWEAYIDMAQLYYKKREFRRSKEYLQKALDVPDMQLYRFRDAEIYELDKLLSVKLKDRNALEESAPQSLH